jgi:hypothetical protein
MQNTSMITWVLVYNETTKIVVSIVEPGLHTQVGGENILKEFPTKEALDKFVSDNKLILPETT